MAISGNKNDHERFDNPLDQAAKQDIASSDRLTKRCNDCPNPREHVSSISW
jgi:hypothetical protein